MISSQSDPTMWKKSITYFYQVYLHLKKPFYTRLGVKGTKRRQWRVIAACWLSFPGHRTLTLQVCWSDRPPIWSLSVWWLNNHLSWSYNLFWMVSQNLPQQWWKCKRSHFNFSEPWDVSDVFKYNKASFSSLSSPPSSRSSFSFFPFLQLFSSVFFIFFQLFSFSSFSFFFSSFFLLHFLLFSCPFFLFIFSFFVFLFFLLHFFLIF